MLPCIISTTEFWWQQKNRDIPLLEEILKAVLFLWIIKIVSIRRLIITSGYIPRNEISRKCQIRFSNLIIMRALSSEP